MEIRTITEYVIIVKVESTLQKVFHSNYCKLVFILFLLLGVAITPSKVFYSWYWILGLLFILVFAATMMCLTRNIKEKVVSARKTNSSILSLLGIIIGVSALHMCTIGAPVCGAAGVGLLALILPTIAYKFMSQFSVYIVILSIILQLWALFSMRCLKFKYYFNKI